jgi:hypothetical protein
MATNAARAAHAPSRPLPPPAEDPVLAHLRAVARTVAIAPPLDLHRACALIAAEGAPGRDSDGALLVRALDRAALRPLDFHPPGARERGFGEAWVLGLIDALRAGDAASALFMVGRGVARQHQRAVLFLARRYAESLGPVALRQMC